MGETYFDILNIFSFCAEALELEECTLLVKRILNGELEKGSREAAEDASLEYMDLLHGLHV